MAALVVTPDFTLARLRTTLVAQLPAYARPLFLRIVAALDLTGTRTFSTRRLEAMTGAIAHHAATSLIFPLPVAGSQPKRTPLPWDAAQPFRGLGFRTVETASRGAPDAAWQIEQYPLRKA